MNLAKKKQLAAALLNVGKNKIKFASDKLPEIKEAITKQDIRDLYKEGFITIKATVGKRKKTKRKTRIGPGKIRTKVKNRKRDYIRITRKLRNYLRELKNRGEIDNESYWEIRKKIKRRYFKSKAYLKEYLEDIKKNKKEAKTEIKSEKPKKQENKKEKSTKTKIKEKKK
jgi:large subunit ribosomal protein L19e